MTLWTGQVTCNPRNSDLIKSCFESGLRLDNKLKGRKMMIDFTSMIEDDEEKILSPREIFFTLNKNPRFEFPRDIQTEVMNSWFEKRDQPDSIIKLNVGSGKTLVGLLLLQSSLNEGKGPALYVAPNKQLADQVEKEAEALGINVVTEPRSSMYESGEAICVINIYKLFNGKSVFGLNVSQINIGTVIIDDVHASVSTITEQFCIKLKNTHEAYKRIFSVLSEGLRGYNEARFLDIESGDPYAHMEVPFWLWSRKTSEILKVLRDYKTTEDLEFTYPLLSDILSLCRCVIGGQHLEIEPHCPKTDLIQSFRNAKRRIYMTATLSDDSVLVTHLGATLDNSSSPIVPASSQSVGERMILMPQELNPHISLEDIRSILIDLASSVNVVVIVPTNAIAEQWKNYANEILVGDKVTSGVAKLRKGHVGLTVFVNRYDGIDLPDNACRVLVLVDLPEVTSYVDIVDGEVLGGSTVNIKRQIERIEQGMGRGVRSNNDYCAVLLVGPKLVRRICSQEGQKMLTPATNAQLALSRKIARELEKPSAEEIKEVIQQCLDRNEGWIKVSKKALIELSVDHELRLDEGKVAICKAFNAACQNQHVVAVGHLDQAIDRTDEKQVKAWLLERKATFQHEVDADAAQETLRAAHRMEPGVTKPMAGVPYKQLSVANEQALQLIQNHTKRFVADTDMHLFVEGLCDDLQFHQIDPNKFENAVNDLAWFIGIGGQRPEKDYGSGPDNLWILSDGSFFVIECKNNVRSENGISKNDVGQLGQSVRWFEENYPSSNCTPVMIHPENTLGDGASSVKNMKVVTREKLEKLRKNIRDFAQQIASLNVAKDVEKVSSVLVQFGLNGHAFINAYSIPVKLKKAQKLNH